MHQVIAWFSCGVSSALAAYFEPTARLLRIRIDDEHADSDRFADEMAAALGRPIEVLQSKYRTVAEVIRATRYVNGPAGASCSRVLKRRVRTEFEDMNEGPFRYVWGLDADERKRAARLVESMPHASHAFPLIERGLTKAAAHLLFGEIFQFIERPAMYLLGYPNNNCVGCVKGGAGYWNKIRVDFPEVFADRARLEREIGRSCINGTYLDELAEGVGECEPALPECGPLCAMMGER